MPTRSDLIDPSSIPRREEARAPRIAHLRKPQRTATAPQGEGKALNASGPALVTPKIREAFGPDVSLSDWIDDDAFATLCFFTSKPCKETGVCRYFEHELDVPGLPLTRKTATLVNEALAAVIEECNTDVLPGVHPLTPKVERFDAAREIVRAFNPMDHPVEIDREVREMLCYWYGGLCPAVFEAPSG